MKRQRPHGSTRNEAPQCLEVINIRLYEPSDRHTVTALYERMAAQYPDARFTLFRNAAVEGDWSIHVWRPRASREEPKSPEARCLFELLREIGLVHHNAWLPADRETGEHP